MAGKVVYTGCVIENGEFTRSVSHLWSYFSVRDRRSQTALALLRIGHTRLTHGYLMSADYQPYCNDCLIPLTVRHVLVECPSLIELRNRFLCQCRGADGLFALQRMLGAKCPSGFNVLYFLEDAGLLRFL